MRKRRIQKGQVVERSGRWYVRFYDKDGKMVTRWICDRSSEFHSAKCKAVHLKRQEFMLAVNSERDVEDKGPAMTLAEFWDGTFGPYSRESKRKSTADSYDDLWSRHVEPDLGDKQLSAIRPADVSQMLTQIAKSGLGRNSVAHVRSVCSAALSHACALGLIDSNPCREAKCLAAAKPPGKTPFYTSEELAKIIEALEGMPDCQAAMGLSFFAGLRTGEIEGLRWADVNLASGVLTVSQSHVRGETSDLKTEESHADLPIVAQLASLLGAWKLVAPPGEYVFSNGKGHPYSLREMSRKRIRPRLREKGLPWKAYYAGRRGLATLIARLRGPLASSQALRHKNMQVTMTNYVKQDKRELAEGMRLLEGAAKAKD